MQLNIQRNLMSRNTSFPPLDQKHGLKQDQFVAHCSQRITHKTKTKSMFSHIVLQILWSPSSALRSP